MTTNVIRRGRVEAQDIIIIMTRREESPHGGHGGHGGRGDKHSP